MRPDGTGSTRGNLGDWLGCSGCLVIVPRRALQGVVRGRGLVDQGERAPWYVQGVLRVLSRVA